MANCRHFSSCSYLAQWIRNEQNIFHPSERNAYPDLAFFTRFQQEQEKLFTSKRQQQLLHRIALAALNLPTAAT